MGGCGTVLAGVAGYVVGSMFLSVIGGIIGAVLAASAVTMLKTSMAKNRVY